MFRVPDAKSDCSCQGEAEVRILNFKTTRSEFHHLPRVSPKQLCALAHLGCTRAAGTSQSLCIIETEFIDKNFLKNHQKVATYCYKKEASKFFSCKEKAKMITISQDCCSAVLSHLTQMIWWQKSIQLLFFNRKLLFLGVF